MRIIVGVMAFGALGALGCRNHMPHAFTWANTGDVQVTHPKPPEGGYHSNWDPFAVEVTLEPVTDVNPVQTQHILVATVKDKHGKGLPNRRVEWMIGEGSVGDIVEVDESGWRASRGYKMGNDFAVSHTNNFKHVINRGNDDPSDDVALEVGQTWCVITSAVEGETHVIAYVPGIYDWNKHKVFALKRWYDLKWDFPPAATNPIGTTHDFVTRVAKYSDNSGLADYTVVYKIVDGPAASFEPGGGTTTSVKTGGDGLAKVTLKQSTPTEGTNKIQIDIIKPDNVACCKPGGHIATGYTSKTWIGPKIACNKTGPASVLAGVNFDYRIVVSNPSQVDAKDIVVTDNIPSGLSYVSSSPAGTASGNTVTWNLGTVAPGTDKTITLTVKGNQSGTFENCAEVKGAHNLSTKCCAKTTVQSPKLIVEKKCTEQIITCENIEYVITVKNPGDGAANNVKITDTLPDGVTTTDGKSSYTANIGTLTGGQSKEIRFTAKASRTGSFNNKVVAEADGGLRSEANCTTVVKQPKLGVTKTGPAKDVYLGRPAEFTITVSNTGDAPARDTVLEDVIPSGAEFVQASDGGRMGGGKVTWTLGTIEPNGSKKVTLTLKAISAGAAVNVATARAFCTDAKAEAPWKQVGVPAILVECVDDPDPIEIGGETTYTITVTNQGSANGTNIVVDCTLPAQEDFVSAAGSATKETVAGKNVKFAPVPTLAPKASVTFKVRVKGNAAGDVRFKIDVFSDQSTAGGAIEESESTRFY